MSAETASGPTEDQVEILEYNFNKVNKHPDPTTLCLIAAEAGLSEEETQALTTGKHLRPQSSERGNIWQVWGKRLLWQPSVISYWVGSHLPTSHLPSLP
ncbi:homeodomain-only protein isoform X2 [Camelus ferus]|uniref:Homeodomain-only protein n=5 Tax=Camelus TaxID=9836 RepID=A0A8B8UIL4_CAMFR|nr:homeodomain-only protein isoform X2 [Camelus ferus]